MRAIPPFHENFDDVHCYECTIRSILEYFEPEVVWTWGQIDELTNKIPGQWSWPQFGLLRMLNRGYDAQSISLFSLEDLLQEGVEAYLIKMQGLEAAAASIKNSPPLAHIEQTCRDLLDHGDFNHQMRLPTLNDIRLFLDEGYLIRSMVNSRVLNNKEGYSGHFVLIYDMDDTHLYMHDSGLPAKPERKVTHAEYLRAATSPKETNWSITGYKLKTL